ncbi:MAG: UDP-3-O-acyl-N-acetylglucosamine deacetylase, partial [Armatimonadetes bacterium]|nr:UDP-3-O-acyl-N-acetylglucosamine deacetylase [Armatimonadota bacterium]
MRRCTPACSVDLQGRAVRTHGGEVTLSLRPGDDGIVFVRRDTGQRYPADLAHHVPVPNCTALGADGRAEVYFVEHVLAALMGLGFSDCEVVLDGPEVPLFDGSALPLVEALGEAGRAELPGEVAPITLDRPIWLANKGRCLGAVPAEEWSIDYSFEHPHPLTPWDHVHLDARTEFATGIAPARTFATSGEIQALMDQGLIQGGDDSMIVVVYDDHLSSPFRLPHELATHKALDLFGDLALLGCPLQARLVAYRTGHADNHALAQRIAVGRAICTPSVP